MKILLILLSTLFSLFEPLNARLINLNDYPKTEEVIDYYEVSKYKSKTPFGKVNNWVIPEFDLYVDDFYKEENYKIYVWLMPLNLDLTYRFKYYKNNDEYIGDSTRLHKKQTMASGDMIMPLIDNTKLEGRIRITFQIKCTIIGVDVTCADFYLDFNNKEIISNNIFRRSIKASINIESGITKVYYEVFRINNLPSIIELDEYGNFLFNDLNITIDRLYLPTSMSHSNHTTCNLYFNFALNDNQMIRLDENYYTKYELMTFKLSKSFKMVTYNNLFYNPANNSLVDSSFPNAIRSDYFHFPNHLKNEFIETNWILEIKNLGLTKGTFYCPFKVKFANIYSEFEVIGKYDPPKKDLFIDDFELEEINL